MLPTKKRRTDFCITCHREAYLPDNLEKNSCNFTCGDPRCKAVEQAFRDLWSDSTQAALCMYQKWKVQCGK
jgi:hypothetical protein